MESLFGLNPLVLFLTSTLAGLVLTAAPGLARQRPDINLKTRRQRKAGTLNVLGRTSVRAFGVVLLLAGAMQLFSLAPKVDSVEKMAENERKFVPSQVQADFRIKGLYLNRIRELIIAEIPGAQYTVESPMTAVILAGTADFPYRFDLLSEDFRELTADQAGSLILWRMRLGPPEREPGEGFFPPSEDGPALVEQARLAWEIGDYRRSVRLAEKSLRIQRGYLGNYHPKIQQLEGMVAAARAQIK